MWELILAMGERSVTLATLIASKPLTRINQRWSPHVSLRQKGARFIADLQWRNTLTNKQAKRIRSTNRKYNVASGQDLCRTTSIARTWVLWTSTASTLNLVDPTHKHQTHTNKQFLILRMSHQQHTIQILTENHVNITNYSNTHGKHVNITNHSTISSRHGPHAIRRIALQSQHACGLALINRTYGNHSAKHLHLSISSSTQTRRLRGMNQKWPRHEALRKRVLDEIIIDVWAETNEHEENAERQKHEQTVIMKSNSGWKTFWRTTAMRERRPPHHFTKKTANSNAQTLHARHTQTNPAKLFTFTSLTKKHVFPIVSQHDMKHGSTWWTRPLPQNSTYCASVTTLDCTSTNNNWQTLCCT